MHGRWILIIVPMILVLPTVSGPDSQPVSEDAPLGTETGCPTTGDPVDPSGLPVSSPAATGRAPLPDLPTGSTCSDDDPMHRVDRTVDEVLDRADDLPR